MFPRFVLFELAFVILFAHSMGHGAEPIDYQRQIQPIFAEHCASCHGVDEQTREAGLRLDDRASALLGGDSGIAAILPGAPQDSELMARVLSSDPDMVMPPPSAKKPLSELQKMTLSKWIEQGAPYTQHWAFRKPHKSKLNEGHYENAIDQIVSEKLHKRNLQLSEPARRETFARRLYLDLIGLPPSPSDLDTMVENSWEDTIDRLLSSERFGEKWARHWLDVARYSDTNGYEKDLRRDQWAWRDWVINALNRDMPYDQFIIEQIAGDMLPNATQSQVIATGFLRNSMLNEEGAIVPEQFRMVEMFDRMDCIGKAILGLTTQCAQCHTHKFDPLTQEEYYGMFAFLNNSYEAKSYVYDESQRKLLHEIHTAIGQLEQQVRNAHPDWKSEIDSWIKNVVSKQAEWVPLKMVELGSISGLNHPRQLEDDSILMLGHTSSDVFMISEPACENATGLRIELLNHGDLPHLGPGRSTTGSWDIKEIEVFVQPPATEEWTKIKLKQVSADFSLPENTTDKGKKKRGPVAFLIDGNDETVWHADRGPGRRNQPSVAAIQFESPLTVPTGARLKVAMRMNSMVGCCRFSLTKSKNPIALPINHAAIVAMHVAAKDRTDSQKNAIFTAWRMTQKDCSELNSKIADQWRRTPNALTTVLHLSERETSKVRTTQLLDRGEWDRGKYEVAAMTPSALHPFPDDAPRNRWGFARWLASKESPLTARVAVNRVWQAIFGTGLVETPEDFGTRAPVPEYLELLDWLAADFMEHNWSQKHLIRQIVTSQVYRQRSTTTAAERDFDPNNRLLARGPRFRTEAEVVRDIALSAAGLIHHRIGGPPTIPPVPKNVLDYNYVYPAFWKPTEGPDRYRRTIYGFRKRSMPDPVMSSFDGPNGDIACARRVRSNTPLAALTGLNETIFVESARAMALRVLREGGDSEPQRIDYAFRLCTSRRPTETERKVVVDLLESRRKRIADGWLNPREIATGVASDLPDLPSNATPQDAAAWTLVARVLLNLDETICKN